MFSHFTEYQDIAIIVEKRSPTTFDIKIKRPLSFSFKARPLHCPPAFAQTHEGGFFVSSESNTYDGVGTLTAVKGNINYAKYIPYKHGQQLSAMAF